MRAPLLVALFAASAFAVACSGETMAMFADRPTVGFFNAIGGASDVTVIGYATPADGGVTLFIGPPDGGYPAGFWYSTSVTMSGPALQTGTFTERNVTSAVSTITTDGGAGPGWTQQYSAFNGPRQGMFQLTMVAVGPQSKVDGAAQWTTPHGQFAATLEPISSGPDAGPALYPVWVDATF